MVANAVDPNDKPLGRTVEEWKKILRALSWKIQLSGSPSPKTRPCTGPSDIMGASANLDQLRSSKSALNGEDLPMGVDTVSWRRQIYSRSFFL